MPTAYLALGSNLGDRRRYIQQAIDSLQDAGIVIVKKSSLIETDPVGGPKQGKYINGVIEINTVLPAEALLILTQSIEKKLGRIKKEINGPRIIDIDILWYDDIKLITPDLLIPHPRMFERDFVMKPLKQIAPRLCASYIR